MTRTLALVGAAGGVGTTRLAVECGAALACDGRDVVVVDAAFATQGLAAYLDCHVEADATALATDETTLAAALYEYPADLPGRLTLCPAAAAFERLARAKRPEAAERLGDRIAAASLAHDAVLVDVPPVAANQAVAAVEAVERLALVTVDSSQGAEALARQRDRLADIGVTPDAVFLNRADDHGDTVSGGHVVHAIPAGDPAGPTCVSPDTGGQFATAVVEAVEGLFGTSLDIDTGGRGVFDRLVGA